MVVLFGIVLFHAENLDFHFMHMLNETYSLTFGSSSIHPLGTFTSIPMNPGDRGNALVDL
jgi:hypothetical protein